MIMREEIITIMLVTQTRALADTSTKGKSMIVILTGTRRFRREPTFVMGEHFEHVLEWQGDTLVGSLAIHAGCSD